jgi:hypothetical protein
MGLRTILGNVVCVLMVVGGLLPVAAFAHDVPYAGTVVLLEAGQLHVRTVDASTKKQEAITFGLTRDTKVKRGDRVVSLAEAAIAVGERVVVIVNHDAAVKNVATEVRLAGSGLL